MGKIINMCETKTKVCSKCGEEKPLTSEYWYKRNKGSIDGFRGECKICYSNRQLKWRKKNTDKVKKYSNNYNCKNW